MTRRRELKENRRPRRVLGELLRLELCCPLCRGQLRVVAYRESTCRLECRECELRFSVEPAMVGHAMAAHPERIATARGDDAAVAFELVAAVAVKTPGLLEQLVSDPAAALRAIENEITQRGELLFRASFLRPPSS